MAYGRIIQATIIPPAQAPAFSSGLSLASAQGGNSQSTSQGQKISDLHMSFKVKKGIANGFTGPTAELKIYNMSLQSYFNFVKINYGLAIAVGYQDEMNGLAQQAITGPSGGQAPQTGIPLTLFSGAIRFCRRYREGPDMIVYIEAEGAMWSVGGAFYSVSYAPGISVYRIFSNLGSSMPVSIRNLTSVPQGVTYSAGFSFSGRVRDLVAQLCSYIGFQSAIDAGEIILVPPLSSGGPTGISTEISNPSASTTGVYLSKDTGLLQPPNPEQTSIGVPDLSSEAPGGSQALPEMRWKIVSLLLPQVGPADVMFVKSENFASGQAYMMAVEIEYTGDNRKDDFKMEARCIPVDSSGAETTIETSPFLQGAPVL